MKAILSFFVFIFGFGTSPSIYANTDNFIILDVRTAEEFNDSHVIGALNIDVLDSNFQSKISKLDKTKTYKLYCRSGNRSGRAAQIMKSKGFSDVENLGSLNQAAKRLNRKCEGKGPC